MYYYIEHSLATQVERCSLRCERIDPLISMTNQKLFSTASIEKALGIKDGRTLQKPFRAKRLFIICALCPQSNRKL